MLGEAGQHACSSTSSVWLPPAAPAALRRSAKSSQRALSCAPPQRARCMRTPRVCEIGAAPKGNLGKGTVWRAGAGMSVRGVLWAPTCMRVATAWVGVAPPQERAEPCLLAGWLAGTRSAQPLLVVSLCLIMHTKQSLV